MVEDASLNKRLSTHPDWHYVIQEFYYTYRYGSAAGSKKIRAHMRAVQTRLTKLFGSDPEIRLQTPSMKPVCDHLGRALDNGEQHSAQAFIRAIRKITPYLNWQYGFCMVKSFARIAYSVPTTVSPSITVTVMVLAVPLSASTARVTS